MMREFSIAEYKQTIFTKEGKVTKVMCECKHFQIHPKNWEEGKNVCWHIKSAIQQAMRKKDGTGNKH